MKTLSVKKLLLFLLLFFSVNQIFAQSLDNNIYTSGQYYDLEGAKHTGFINFSFNAVGTPRIRFKTDSLGSDDQKIEIKSLKAVVIYRKVDDDNPNRDYGSQKDTNIIKLSKQPKMVADSFVVLNETTDGSSNSLKTRLALFIVEGVNAKIYSREAERSVGFDTPTSHTFVTDNGYVKTTTTVTQYGDHHRFFTKTFYLYEVSGKVFELNRDNFEDTLYAAFSDDPDLLDKIITKKYRFRDLGTIINEYKKFKRK